MIRHFRLGSERASESVFENGTTKRMTESEREMKTDHRKLFAFGGFSDRIGRNRM